jgi:transcriptional regulator GlxA family with amidase domain
VAPLKVLAVTAKGAGLLGALARDLYSSAFEPHVAPRKEEPMSSKTIAFLVFPDLTPLDLVGPMTVLKMLESQGYSAVTVAGRIEPIVTDVGFSIVPERTFDEVPEPFALILPGGVLGPIKAMVDDRLMGWVRAAAEKATVVGSVCTGSLILGAAGLLEGLEATTHWAFLHTLEKMGARPTRRRWVEDGKVITAAGVSAGIDMALALAARLTSEGVARNIQHIIEYYPEPPFGSDSSKADLAEIGRQLGGMSAAIPQILAGRPELARFF